MKIAIVTSTFPPYAGGIGNVAAFNARELVKLGHEVTVFTPLYKKVKEEITDLKIVRVKPLFQYGNAAYVPALKNMLKGFDIIHLHYPFFGGAEVVMRQHKKFQKSGTKIVLHYHMDVVGQGLLKIFFQFHNKFILPRIIKISDKVIFTSFDYGRNSNAAKWLNKFPQKFAEVPNGVDTNRFSPQPKNPGLLAREGISSEDKVVLFVGGLDKAHYFKGIEYLIEAMSRLRQAEYSWKLLIVGVGDLKRSYQDLAGQLQIGSDTIFAGYVSNADLPNYYNLADVGVLPSVDKSEAFGLTLVEAMACGKPVVASDLAGVRSVVINEVDGLLSQPKNADDLAAKINFFLENSEEAADYGRAGRQQTRQKYDWQIIGWQLDRIYKSLKA